jgi:hypothetical protein
LLAQGKLGLGLGERGEGALPGALKTACNQAMLGLDLAVAALGSVSFITCALQLQSPLRKRRIVVGPRAARLRAARPSLQLG